MAIIEKPIQAPEVGVKAYLVEIFSAIQGEGPIVGLRQIFLRFLGCHIACAYCDTPATHTRQRQCRIERTPGLRDFQGVGNPLSLEQVLAYIGELETFPGLHDGISLTGGEPLQHVKTLKGLLPALRPRFPVYLETDGILYDNLAQVVAQVDTIGMDIKLPSATGLQAFWDEHRRFIQVAARREIFVKVVVTRETVESDLREAIAIVKECDNHIPLVLQPVTPYGVVRHPPNPSQLLAWQALAKRELKDVRVIPQTHKLIGQL